MRIAVVGLGGVGGYIGASLAKTSHEIVGFARGEHLREIQKNGIKIIEDTKKWDVKLDARDIKDADGFFDIVIFCTKSYDLKSTYNQIKPYLKQNSICLSLSNGVANGDVLRDLGASRVLDSTVYILSSIKESGVICKKGEVFSLVFGGDGSDILESVFKEAELRTKVPNDIKKALWSKFLFISTFATLTSYYNNSIGYVCQNHSDETEKLISEIVMVAESIGVDISLQATKIFDTAKGLPYASSTSMYLDFKNKKADELETITGHVVKLAKINDVQVPLMQKMYEKLLTKHITN